MPPKAAKKTVEKQKAKIIEDKTFGLKNKKGAKQQKFIQQVQKQVSTKGQAQRRDVLDPAAEREKRKEEEKKKKEELAMLFKPVIAAQVISKGADPKSVVCVFYKQGLCQKGDKCKFSHDLTKDRKGEKRSIYDDAREKEEGDTMENWDEEKLEDVINTKHGEDNKQKNATQIVCKYFIEAVENSTYGWFWVCPNEKEGGRCIYRHALPPGFTLKKDKKKADDDGLSVSLEALIETERAALGPKQTKITLESFLAWKLRKIQEKKDKASEQEEKKKRDFKLGFMNGLTGRDIFTFNPDLITTDDAEAGNDIDYRHRVDDEEEEEGGEQQEGATAIGEIKPKKLTVRELNESFLASQATETDNTGTVATADRFEYIKDLMAKVKKSAPKDENNDDGKLGMACGGGDVEDIEEGEEEEYEEDEEGEEDGDNENATAKKKNKENNVEIDESLFNVEDLGDIQDELENLDI